MDSMRQPYPEGEPYNFGMLSVSNLHQVYYEECGNKGGNPVIFLHGGPGSACTPSDMTYFDPEVYRIVMMDQRGAGRSTPKAELRENTTWDLVSDIEKLREHLGIDKWVVFGTSWGSTLALAYAETHPDRVKAMVIGGIFTLQRREITWVNQDGANMLFPDYWDNYLEPIPEVERFDLTGAYYRRLTGDDEEVMLKCAKAWTRFETVISAMEVNQESLDRIEKGTWAVECAKLECHYFIHGGFLEREDQLIANAYKLRDIPMTIVQGRYDVVCPMVSAWRLHKTLPNAEFYVIPNAGHTKRNPATRDKLLQACEKYKHL